MTIHLIVELMKKILFYKMNYFPELDIHNKSKIKFELDLYNNAVEPDLKNARGVETSDFDK